MSLPADLQRTVISALEQYELPLQRYALRLTQEWELARDCVQHAFLRLCEKLPLELEYGVGPWLYAVVRNRAIDGLRQRDRAGQFQMSDERAIEDAEQLLEPYSREVDPHDHATDQELSQLLRGLVSELPLAQQEVVFLWADGLNSSEIATTTQRTAGAVRVLLHRALQRLKESSKLKLGV
jgi:RNA polymerase sigma factor (sigma-70 family)